MQPPCSGLRAPPIVESAHGRSQATGRRGQALRHPPPPDCTCPCPSAFCLCPCVLPTVLLPSGPPATGLE
eukprot:scaffold132475_cov63-Phaeocystis_antarctica.AAC.2